MEAVEHIVPKYFNPALEIIPVPNYLNKSIAFCLVESFKLFWIDNSACANKIRIMVEAIMNERKIPKTVLKSGKRSRINLHKRIEKFQIKNQEVGERLIAIKWIGNDGSHEMDVLKREDILNAYEILLECFEKLYNPRPAALLKIVKKINKNKGVKNK